MLEIDGSSGEGGGQIIRTSVALSALTGTPIRIVKIRAKRENPGLRPQHLSAVKAVSELCDARVSGLSVGSREVEFEPGRIKGRNLDIDIGTAGSVTLVLQSLLAASVRSGEKISFRITGGTDVKLAPGIDYTMFVMLPILKLFNYNVEADLLKRGYYPKGGGSVCAVVHPSKLSNLNLAERGKILKVMGVSHAHSGLKGKKVSERQKESAEKILINFGVEAEIKTEYNSALSFGSGVTLYAVTENSVLGSSSLGEIGKSSENVGKEAALNLIKEIEKGGAVDSHMSDQIIPYLALSKGAVKVNEMTNHAKTNLETVNLFGFNLKAEGNFIYSD